MLSQCANPRCCKPLHYLRDGRVYLFAISDPQAAKDGGDRPPRIEHFWLCGNCSQSMILVQEAQTIRTLPRRQLSLTRQELEIAAAWERS
jgi:hypothetical protein